MKNGATTGSLLTTKFSQCAPSGTGVTTDPYHSNLGQVLEEHQGGSSSAQYMWTPFYLDKMIERDNQPDGCGRHDVRLNAEQDANYNVTSISNSCGAVVERYQYDPYGNVTVLDAGASIRGDGTIASSSYGTNYTFQGGRIDVVTGLVHFNARDYDPSMGRWTQHDPAGYVDGSNLYEFASSSPVGQTDSSGLDWKVDRAGKERADATGGSGDTVAKLADLVHLDPAEYKKWLKSEDGKPLPASATDDIGGSCKFSVPNTMYATRGDVSSAVRGKTFGFVRAWSNHRLNGWASAQAAKGYKVVYDWDVTLASLQKYMADPNIAGWGHVGHGHRGYLDLTNGDVVSNNLIPSLDHHLSLVTLMVCEAGQDIQARAFKVLGWNNLVSTNGELDATPDTFWLAFDDWTDLPKQNVNPIIKGGKVVPGGN